MNAERLLALENAYPNETIRVTYEPLVVAPQTQLARITTFLELPEVPNLASLAFEQPHDFGPGDPLIRTTSRPLKYGPL